MIALLVALALLIPVASDAQDPRHVDELRALARAGSDSALVERVQQRPDATREALRQLLASGVEGDTIGLTALTAAERIAGALVVAWRDSFLLRRVARFRSLSPADRRTTVAADSLEIAGIEASRRSGPDSAIRTWRQSLRRFEALADTDRVPATLTRIGGGFYQAQEYDSADAYLTRSLGQAQRIGDYLTVARALRSLGAVSERRGDLPRASELYARAKQICERYGALVDLARIQNNTANVAGALGDRAGRDRAYQAALVASRSAGDADLTAMILSNIGTYAMQDGDYGEAADRFHESLSIYHQRRNQLDALVVLYNLGALETRRADYPTAVARLSEAARLLERTGPSGSVNEIDVRVALSQARALMGNLQAARSELNWAETVATRRGGQAASLAALALAQGDLALQFNRLAEAERQYTRAERLARGPSSEADPDQMRNRAQYGMARVLFMRESYKRAQTALEQLLLRRSLDTHNAIGYRELLGLAAWRGGDTATARSTFMQALDTLRELGAVTDEAEVLGLLGALEAEAGRWVTAESLYQYGLTRLGARPAPAVAWQLHANLGASLRSRGVFADAARELEAGIDEIERVSGTLELEEHRSAFRADKWDLYVDLAMVEYARGRTAAALEASERLRGRQMLDLLARGRVGGREQLRELSVREQDLRRKMEQLTLEAENSEPEHAGATRDPAPSEKATGRAGKELAQLQKEYRELLLRIREADPSYASLVRGEIVPARAVMAGLAPDEALLEYLVGDSTALVFIVTADSLTALDLKLSHDALAAEVDFARGALATRTQGGVRRAWRPPLRRLYRQLVGPAEATGLLKGKRRLIIAPHAELHYLPFSALVQPGPLEQLLIERYLIEYVPSASVWLRLRSRPERAPGGGILALAPRAKVLPGSRAEVAAIRRIYGDRAQTLVGALATERAFRALAPDQEIVHLATYGVLNKHNPLFSFVEMGAGAGEDGRLEVHEVFGLTLNARLLVLSACQTGVAAGELADVPPGDDWVGLVQGFLYAGASNVLATLWPVADVATARLMERFYRELATGRSVAEALALAQRAALRDPTMVHPFFWAGFALVRGR
jgi:CHAT domain-containing protein